MTHRRTRPHWIGALTASLLAAPALLAQVPQGLSPGSPAAPSRVFSSCPTFSWSWVEGASGYEVVVYQIEDDGTLEQQSRVRFPGGGSWTPAADECPAAGEEYAWAVRALTDAGPGPWSELMLFSTAGAPPDDQVREALEVLRRYAEGFHETGPAQTGRVAQDEGEPASASLRAGTKQPNWGPLPRQQAIPTPTSFSLAVDGSLNIGGALFKNGLPILHSSQNLADVGLGYAALESVTTGAMNTAVGHFALSLNFTGNGNTAVGTEALAFSTSGSDNTALGRRALRVNYTGQRNTAIGSVALYSNGIGSRNTAAGFKALYENTIGLDNTAVGDRALVNNIEGNSNTALGYISLFNNTTGLRNTANGVRALFENVTGNNNTALGYDAGANWTTGSNNVALGVGAKGLSGESGVIRIGGENRQSQTFIEGISGIGVSGVAVMVTATDQLGVATSSARFKQDIHDLEAVSERLQDLRPVSFRYKEDPKQPEPNPLEYGLIAEEVAEVFPELVVRDEDGRPYTVRYHLLTPLLLAEIQRQQQALIEQQHELADLRQRLDRMAPEQKPRGRRRR